ncbi:MAG TPA: hypothetical protein VF680_02975 [Allosphingosinicella sp.]|jgi:hypothetical protein
MTLEDIKKILAGPYKARIETVGSMECAICDYFGRAFWVYLMPGEEVEQLVFSYITAEPVTPLSNEELNEFHFNSHVSRVFYDSSLCLNLNAKLIGRLEDLSIKSFVMFLKAWMNDFDRILPKLHERNE